MTTKKDDDFLTVLEKGIRKVLEQSDSTAKERMEAVKAGTQLMLIKHKISNVGDESGSFFDKR